jgi:hypothetical protein
MTIDLNSSKRNAPKKSKEVIKFAVIKYFIVHTYNDRDHMLAYVQLAKNVITDSYGLKFFEDFGSHKIIEIIGIDHCVGFISFIPPGRNGNVKYIIDNGNIDF